MLPFLDRRRIGLGCALVAATVLVPIGARMLLDPRSSSFVDLGAAVARLAVQMTLLSLVWWEWERRRSSTLGSLAVAAVVGIATPIAFDLVVFHAQAARKGLSLDLLAVDGLVKAQATFWLWIAAFVYPYVTARSLRRTADAEREVEGRRLQAILEPHFLLNSLNAVSACVPAEASEARHLLGVLGDLYQEMYLDAGERQELAREIDWLRRYGELLEARYAGQLTFRWRIDDEARSWLVPRFILQPIVENAVQHGALASWGEGQIDVAAAVRRGNGEEPPRLEVTVRDNGPGLAATEPRGDARGLRIVRRRLALASRGARLELRSDGEGTTALVVIPREPDDDA